MIKKAHKRRSRHVFKSVFHALWFGLEINGATAAGDGSALMGIYESEHERIVTHEEHKDKTDKA